MTEQKTETQQVKNHEHTHEARKEHKDANHQHHQHQQTPEQKQEDKNKTTEKEAQEKETKETEQKKQEAQTKQETITKPQTKQTEKKEAIARGLSLPLSKKHCMYISRFIKNKTIDKAIKDLELVIKFKKAVPFKGEIPHRKGKGMMSGRYPQKAAKSLIKILKGLKGSVLVNNMDLDKTIIYLSSASWASRPQRREGRRAKRTNLIIKAKEIDK